MTAPTRRVNRPSVTLRDVAKLADVSPQTVSNIINKRPVHREETRRRVEEAIAQLGYTANANARSLRSQRTRTLGVLFESSGDRTAALRDPMHADLLAGLASRANEEGYQVTVIVSTPEQTAARIGEVTGERRIDGLALSLQGSEQDRLDLLGELGGSGLPVVAIERRVSLPGVSFVVADNERGGALLAELLGRLGHRRVALVAGDPLWPAPERRIAAFEAAAGRLEMHIEHVSAFWERPSTSREAAHRLLAEAPDVTAVFASNDVLALGVLQAAEDLGFHVPADLSVVGFDDFDFASILRPALTTIRVPAVSMGRRCADLLLSAEPHSETLPTELVVRDSSGPARARDPADQLR